MSEQSADDELRKRRIEKEDGRYLIYYTDDGDELLGLTETTPTQGRTAADAASQGEGEGARRV